MFPVQAFVSTFQPGRFMRWSSDGVTRASASRVTSEQHVDGLYIKTIGDNYQSEPVWPSGKALGW